MDEPLLVIVLRRLQRASVFADDGKMKEFCHLREKELLIGILFRNRFR